MFTSKLVSCFPFPGAVAVGWSTAPPLWPFPFRVLPYHGRLCWSSVGVASYATLHSWQPTMPAGPSFLVRHCRFAPFHWQASFVSLFLLVEGVGKERPVRWWRCQLDMQVVVTEQLQEGHLCEARCLSVAPELTHSRGCWNCLPICRVKAVTKAGFSGRTT